MKCKKMCGKRKMKDDDYDDDDKPKRMRKKNGTCKNKGKQGGKRK